MAPLIHTDSLCPQHYGLLQDKEAKAFDRTFWNKETQELMLTQDGDQGWE